MSKSYEQWVTDVQNDGWALEYVPEIIIDEHLCQEAIKQNGLALRFVPETMKSYALCLMAVEQEPSAMEFVPEVYQGRIVQEVDLV